MRVLVVHNQYRSEMPSGENEVVLAEVDALRAAGVDVDTYFRSSDEIASFSHRQRAALAVRPIFSLEDARELRRRIVATRPNVVHLHNPFPLISPWAVRVAKSEGVPVVQTVHNYRHSCPAGEFFRDGVVCEECSGKRVPWPAVMHGCYRGSRPQSAVMAASAGLHHSTWSMVDRYLPVSAFVAEHLVRSGIPRDRIVVRPNSAQPGAPVRPPGSGFVFVGRLTPEKGISLLIDAWKRSTLWETERLVVAGDGPERNLVLDHAHRNVHYLGTVDRAHVSTLLDDAAVVVIPSLWYEGYPRVVAESFERGRPVAATALGALADLITADVGWTAAPDPRAFATMLGAAAADPDRARKGIAARSRFDAELDPSVTMKTLIDLYASLSAGGRGERHPRS